MGHYVYRLIDPRDGSTFYIGRGSKSRVLDHASASLKFDEETDKESEKIGTILGILAANLEPIHVIHRHGLTEEQAVQVEAALIDFVPGLTNVQGGEGSGQYGPANLKQLVELYEAETIELSAEDRVMAISVNKSVDDLSMYDAVRAAWRVNVSRAERAQLVFAMVKGICRQVYVPESWHPALKETFPFLLNDVDGRYGFIGVPAAYEIQQKYNGKKLPDNMQRRKGAASPVLYSYE